MDVEILGFVQFFVVSLEEAEPFLDDPVVQLLVQVVLCVFEPIVPERLFLLFFAPSSHVAGALDEIIDDFLGDCLFQFVVDVLDHGIEAVHDHIVFVVFEHAVEGA